jgi:hypothetical protein
VLSGRTDSPRIAPIESSETSKNLAIVDLISLELLSVGGEGFAVVSWRIFSHYKGDAFLYVNHRLF